MAVTWRFVEQQTMTEYSNDANSRRVGRRQIEIARCDASGLRQSKKRAA